MTSRFTLTCLLALPLCWLCSVASAAELSPAGAEAQALRQNPDLAAARFRIEEARGRLKQSGRRPNPELQIEAGNYTNFREGSFMLGLVQKFPATNKLRLEKEVSQALLDAAEAEVKVAERQVLLLVRQLAVKLLAIKAQQTLRAKQLANANELAAFVTKRAESGEISGLEAVQIELEAQQIQLETLQENAEQAGLNAELRPLLGLSSENPVTIAGGLEAPKTTAAGSPEARPEYVVLQQTELAAQRNIALEKARRRDDISAGFFAGAQHTEDEPLGFQNDGLIGLRVNIPLPFWNQNEGKIQEATAAAARLAAEKEALTQRIKGEQSAAVARMQTLSKLISEIDSALLPKTRSLEQKLHAAYAAGQSPLTDVLRARDKRIQLERTRLDSLRDYHLIRASLGLGL
jgi:cobalt-zinc-cadmium efflux system outer membrane protein